MFNTVVKLTLNQRVKASPPEQATFRDLLNQLHMGDCNKDDLNLLFCWQLIIHFLAYHNSAHNITPTSYRDVLSKSVKTRKCPVFIGPIFIHQTNLSKLTYSASTN
ncbi:hypothetical protein pdam_00014085, partial [Pocillopora damicornis]